MRRNNLTIKNIMVKPPDSFDLEAYEESLGYITQAKMDKSAYLALAMVAGGDELVRAINKYSFPPCDETIDCSTCWASKYCVHIKTPQKLRSFLARLKRALDALVNKPESAELVKKMLEVDKTDLLLIQSLLDREEKSQTG